MVALVNLQIAGGYSDRGISVELNQALIFYQIYSACNGYIHVGCYHGFRAN